MERQLSPNDHPIIRSGEYEATVWHRSGGPGQLDLVRYDLRTQPDLTDSCSIAVRLATADEVASIILALERFTGRAVERLGELPRGGDFLTPRFDSAATGYGWHLERSDLLLSVRGRAMTLEIKARPQQASTQHEVNRSGR